jgi:superfamily II DNA or RNA helicase
MKNYNDFLSSKMVSAPAAGFEVSPDELNTKLFDFQKYTVSWALRRGKAAIFAECGTGKTAQQLEFGSEVCKRTNRDTLILTPLAVAPQTEAEGVKFDIPVTLCQSQDDVKDGINVVNYERLHLMNPDHFAGVILDESSILKSYMGATKQELIRAFASTPYKLACTATPAPNDHMELGNHSEFLGVMPSDEMLARWFINDTAHFGRYRVKGHAEADYWRWVASWAMCISKPSDIGFSDEGFELPPLHTHEHCVDVDLSDGADGKLFRTPDMSATGLHKEMRLTTSTRAGMVADLVTSEPNESWIIWVNTNYESEAIAALLKQAVEIRGSDTVTRKENALRGFADGSIKWLITKPGIAGFGLNWQHCARAAFMGLSYSFEQYYQALRRIWRFGQLREVYAHIVMARTEAEIVRNVFRKERGHSQMQANMARAISEMHRMEVAGRSLRLDAGNAAPIVPAWLRAA